MKYMTEVEWSAAMDVEREVQIAKGYDDAHDAEHGPEHLLNWAIDYARIGRPLAAATMTRSAMKLSAEASAERNHLRAYMQLLINDLDQARADGTVLTYGYIQHRLREALEGSNRGLGGHDA